LRHSLVNKATGYGVESTDSIFGKDVAVLLHYYFKNGSWDIRSSSDLPLTSNEWRVWECMEITSMSPAHFRSFAFMYSDSL